ncbi:putative odorant receptor 69a [Cimex lectularius]|uniref:Odorant receptor n=1 Tax=Cimex lectularius TaxID=79782 RepID=A0A8I6SAA9_CIMLE|nr:putative odorant receptor 69a [Cimex lectularius]
MKFGRYYIERPSNTIYHLYELGGMMVSPGSKHPYLVKFNIVFVGLGMFYFLTTQLLTLYTKIGDQLVIMQFTISTCQIMFKHCMIFVRKKQIVDFISDLDVMWEKVEADDVHKKLFNETIKGRVRYANTFMLMCFCVQPYNVLFWLLTIMTKPREEWEDWIVWWNLVDAEHFWLRFIVQIYCFEAVMISEGVTGSMVTYLCAHISGYTRVLRHMLESRLPDNKSQYKETYIFHQKIIKLVRKLNSIYSVSYFVEIVTSSLTVAFRSFFMVKLVATNGIGGSFAAELLLTILEFFAPYTISMSCELIKSEGEEIIKSAYHNSWYEEDPSTEKDLLILSAFATRPLLVRYKTAFEFSMEKFSTFVQATYSYIAMLKNMNF